MANAGLSLSLHLPSFRTPSVETSDLAYVDENVVYDPGEPIATADATGRYRFTTPASGPIIATGGTHARTGLPFTQTFAAPAGSLSVTAFSTLVQKMV